MENNIRNFAIIAHIDHGKTTLTDRLLEVTNTITSDKLSSQHLDSMSLEKEKGITIKMHPCRMEYVLDNQKYILNLLDTPGHVDFIYEVSRALAAVEGVILLVDATQGVQAQTLANLQLALNHNLKIIGVLNKIDLNPTRTEELKQEIAALINTTEDQIICVSAKTGKNVDILLQRIVSDFPCPEKEEEKDLRALIFDSKYDSYKGVLAYVRVVEGKIKKTDDLYLMAQKTRCKALELGYFKPNLVNSETISSGEIG
ncbi:MAG: GTP-binding protein [Candidatus Pacebacteria bacterium]|nr:GTP-binding protein [Candidatus Paceibacterota bacterium]